MADTSASLLLQQQTGKNAATTRGGGVGLRRALVRVEPKTFFALERTLLDWSQLAVLQGSIAIGLAHYSGGPTATLIRWCGQFMAFLSICFLFYALHVYKWRSKAIASKAVQKYEDEFAPLLMLLSNVLGVTFAVVAHVLRIL